MKSENELYHRSIRIFCHAYCNNTIEYGSQCGSPVGNLIAANLNYEIRKASLRIDPRLKAFFWFKDGVEIDNYYYKFIYADKEKRMDFFQPAMMEIDATGYSIHSLYSMDEAFESVNEFGAEENKVEIIYGLFAAINQLRIIHELYDFEEPMQFSENINVEVSPVIIDNLIKRYRFLKS